MAKKKKIEDKELEDAPPENKPESKPDLGLDPDDPMLRDDQADQAQPDAEGDPGGDPEAPDDTADPDAETEDDAAGDEDSTEEEVAQEYEEVADFPRTDTEKLFAEALNKQLDGDFGAFESAYKAFCAANGPAATADAPRAPEPVSEALPGE